MKLKLMRWTGGKYRMTQIINPLMPECSEYYEPFLGSGAVLLNKCRTEKEIVNDLDEDLYKLHTVLADHDKMTELLNRLDKHPVNEETFIQAKECLDKKPEERVGAVDTRVEIRPEVVQRRVRIGVIVQKQFLFGIVAVVVTQVVLQVEGVEPVPAVERQVGQRCVNADQCFLNALLVLVGGFRRYETRSFDVEEIAGTQRYACDEYKK